MDPSVSEEIEVEGDVGTWTGSSLSLTDERGVCAASHVATPVRRRLDGGCEADAGGGEPSSLSSLTSSVSSSEAIEVSGEPGESAIGMGN